MGLHALITHPGVMMEPELITIGSITSAYYSADGVLINTTADALDLIANAPSTNLILHEHHLSPDYFDLSTRKLGDVLQKFVNYHIRLAIIGTFSCRSTSWRDFVYESNRQGTFLFVDSLDVVKERWKDLRE